MKHSKSAWIFALVLLWAGIALLVSSSSASEPELIPREILFGNPLKTAPTISPDGKLLAYLAPLDNVLNVWVRTVGAEDDRVVIKDNDRGIRRYFWAASSTSVLSSSVVATVELAKFPPVPTEAPQSPGVEAILSMLNCLCGCDLLVSECACGKANEISAFVGTLVNGADSKSIVLDKLVEEYGLAILADGEEPSKRQPPEAGLVTPAEIAAEVIPQEGAPTPYGVSLSLNNTRRFIDYYHAVTLTPEQESTMRNALLPLKAPCCDDKSMATCCCPCNLAKSVWGLSNYLIVEKNYDVDQVRESALQWLRFIHSDYYVIQELSNRGIDPGMYGLSHENACYVDECELPFVNGGCGGMGELRQ